MKKRTEIAFVDAIDEEICRVLIGGKSTPVTLPRSCLPKTAAEGDWLKVSFELLPEAREANIVKIKKMLAEMANNPDISNSMM